MVPQNVYEFRATATRPIALNGLGLSVPECQVQVARVRLVPPPSGPADSVCRVGRTLVGAHSCYGRGAQMTAARRRHADSWHHPTAHLQRG